MNERNDTHLQKVPIPLIVKNPLPLFQNPPPDFPISFLFSTLPNEKQTKKTSQKFLQNSFQNQKKENQKNPPVCYLSPLFFRKPKIQKIPSRNFCKNPKRKILCCLLSPKPISEKSKKSRVYSPLTGLI